MTHSHWYICKSQAINHMSWASMHNIICIKVDVKKGFQVQLRIVKKLIKSGVDGVMYLLLTIESKGSLC